MRTWQRSAHPGTASSPLHTLCAAASVGGSDPARARHSARQTQLQTRTHRVHQTTRPPHQTWDLNHSRQRTPLGGRTATAAAQPYPSRDAPPWLPQAPFAVSAPHFPSRSMPSRAPTCAPLSPALHGHPCPPVHKPESPASRSIYAVHAPGWHSCCLLKGGVQGRSRAAPCGTGTPSLPDS